MIPEASSARSRDGDEEGGAWLGCSIDACETKSSAVGIQTDALRHPRSNGNEGISIGKAIYFKERVTHRSPWALAPDLRHDTFNVRCHLAVRRYGLHLTIIEGTMQEEEEYVYDMSDWIRPSCFNRCTGVNDPFSSMSPPPPLPKSEHLHTCIRSPAWLGDVPDVLPRARYVHVRCYSHITSRLNTSLLLDE